MAYLISLKKLVLISRPNYVPLLRNIITKKQLTSIKKVISNLLKNNSIIVLKQDKGKVLAIMNRKKYLDTCSTILDSNNFTRFDEDPTCNM